MKESACGNDGWLLRKKRGGKSISCLINIGPVPPPQLSLVNRNDGENRGGFRILCI